MTRCLCPPCVAVRGYWLTPAELDHERIRWRRFKPPHGGWNQALWIVLQDEWRKAL